MVNSNPECLTAHAPLDPEPTIRPSIEVQMKNSCKNEPRSACQTSSVKNGCARTLEKDVDPMDTSMAAIAVCLALSYTSSVSIDKLEIESDSKQLIDCLNHSSPTPWRICSLVQDIWALKNSFSIVKLSFISCKINKAPHWAATRARINKESTVWTSTNLHEVESILAFDVLNSSLSAD
ncbi:hypothetical protein Cni_G02960 [Canna indica]|uniref:RNase H type-1 domain-containing protein n=1 Tax=Canna indica TaxID=4628 RepID=A0AAQ3JRP5_9LILI|nr:hypothetical protein Cni_G02960 [Canna indica]